EPAAAAHRLQQQIERDLDRLDAFGNGDVVSVSVLVVALPVERLAAGLHAKPCLLVDGSDGAVGAGNPLGVVQGERASGGGERNLGVNHPATDVGQIDFDRNGRGIGGPRGRGQEQYGEHSEATHAVLPRNRVKVSDAAWGQGAESTAASSRRRPSESAAFDSGRKGNTRSIWFRGRAGGAAESSPDRRPPGP